MSQNQSDPLDLPAQHSPYWHSLPAEMRLAFHHVSAQRYLILLPVTVRAVHGHAGAAVLLTFFLFRLRYSADAEGWFQATRESIEAWTGMARDAQESARERLRKLGFVGEVVRGLPSRLYFRVNMETLYARLLELERASSPAGGAKPPGQGGGLSPTSKEGDKPHNLAGGQEALEGSPSGTAQTGVFPHASIKELTTNIINSPDTSYQDPIHELTSNSLGRTSQGATGSKPQEEQQEKEGVPLYQVSPAGFSAGGDNVNVGTKKSSRQAADAVRIMCESLGLTGWRLAFARTAMQERPARDAWWWLARNHHEILKASYRLLDKTGERGPVTWGTWLPELAAAARGYGEGAVLAAMERTIQEATPAGVWRYFQSRLQSGDQPVRPPVPPAGKRAELEALREQWEARTKAFSQSIGAQP